jgi:uncharacterized protein YkwD
MVTSGSVRWLTPVLVAVLLAPLLVVAPPAAEATTALRTKDEQRVEKRLFENHNRARANPGAYNQGGTPVAPLLWAHDVAEVARAWSDEMARTGAFEHNPSYTSQTCCWTMIGENIIVTWPYGRHGTLEQLADALMQGWMDSAGHRQNIMTAGFDHVGIGVTLTSDERAYATAVFRKANAKAPKGSATYVHPTAETPKLNSGENACPADLVPASGFTDVSGNQVLPTACLKWWNVTGGITPTIYRPAGTVTRGQMASFIARSIRESGGSLSTTAPQRFRDVDPTSTHAAAINALAAAGVIDGYRDGTYRPAAPVERGHMAKFLVQSFEYRTGKPLPSPTRDWFPDDDGYVLESDINRIADAGWAGGFSDGTYRHGQTVRRDHMAYFLTRWLDTLVVKAYTATP